MKNPRPLAVVLLLAAVIIPRSAHACDEIGEMRRALADASANAAAYRQDAVTKALAEAALDKDIMEEYLSLVYFPGMWTMRQDAVTITAQDSAAYRAVSARLAFLRAAPGAKITLKPGADRAAQFEALKADYASALARAGEGLRGLGEDPAKRQPLWALTEWGVESSVDDSQVLTRAQSCAILAKPALPQRDPHE